MTPPVRLRLSRRKGFDLQAHSQAVNGLDAVVVARPSIYGNPFQVGRDGTRDECAGYYRALLAGFIVLAGPETIEQLSLRRAAILGNVAELRGKNLACWCALDGKPCHADVLLKLANPTDDRA